MLKKNKHTETHTIQGTETDIQKFKSNYNTGHALKASRSPLRNGVMVDSPTYISFLEDKNGSGWIFLEICIYFLFP